MTLRFHGLLFLLPALALVGAEEEGGRLLEEDEVCCARSCCSHSATDRPRPAASRAMPAPLMPPPTTKRSYSSVIRRFSVLDPYGFRVVTVLVP